MGTGHQEGTETLEIVLAYLVLEKAMDLVHGIGISLHCIGVSAVSHV